MARAKPGFDQAINQITPPVTDFGPDPRGTDLFTSLFAAQGAPLAGHDGQVYVGDRGAPERSFNGDLGHDVQAFTGAAALAQYGAATPISPHSGTFDTARSADALDDAPLRIFAARANRQAAR